MADPNLPRPVSGTPAWTDPYSPTSSPPYGYTYDTRPLPAHRTTPMPVPVPMETVIAQIGDIQVTSTTVRTPIGSFPLRGSRWHVQDQWITSQKTPGWAIAMAIIGFFCLTVFSLLFLLAKETVYAGVVQVTVTNGPFQYDTRVGAGSQLQVQQVHNMVNYVRSLSVI